MTGEEWRRVKAILADALALPQPERERMLEKRLAGEPELEAEVRSLLAAHETDGSLLEPPAVAAENGAEAVADAGALEPGARVGAYRVIREIGRGGMGIVLLAERADDSFERQVALKLIQHGAAGWDLERRFLRERRILARLDHPGIARLLDGGTTIDGRPYLIMEHVEGEPIDAYCREHDLDVDARLDLFLAICSAVDFAHRNLVVHRDLKPSNVLVAADGTAKLLDFGIATLLEDPMGEPDEQGVAPTRTGLHAMTPEYASPEQIRGEVITTSTDVYALGVILYQLLVGHRPYELRDRALSEVVRVVCEQDPQPPSSAVGAAGPPAERPTVFGRGVRTELARRLRGDLDAIVMKALRKEPAERYRSAEELAADLRRYRQGLPVEARRGSFAYGAGKLVRRYRVAVSAVAAFVVLLAAFAVSMAVQATHTRRALVRAEEEAAKASAVQAFLEETLGAADPQASEGSPPTVEEALDRARDRLEISFGGQPETKAAVEQLIGKLYSNLGAYDDAEPLLRRALASRRRLLPAAHEELAETLESLGLLLGRTGRSADAGPLLEEALAMRLELAGSSSLEVANDLDLLAHVANAQGDPRRAVDLERRALEAYRQVLGESPSVAHALATIAGFEQASGDLDAAEPALRQAVRILDGLSEPPLATRGEIEMDLGELLEAQGRYEEAEAEIRNGLDAYRRIFGDEHHWVAQGLVRLGTVLTRQGRYDEAEELLRRGVATAQRVLGPDHPDVATSLNNLAFMLAERGDLAEASQVLETVLEMQRRTIPDHPAVGVTLRSLGLVELRRGHPAEARRHLEEALAIQRRHYGEDHPRTARSRLALGWAVGELGDWPKAVAMQRQALDVLESTYGADRPDQPQVAEARSLLGESLARLGQLDEAEELLERALPVLQKAHGLHHHRVRRILETLADVAEARGRPEQGAAYRTQLAEANDEAD